MNRYERRVYGIRTFPRYDPSRHIPVVSGYEIVPWEEYKPEQITEEPLTRREAEAFLKLLTGVQHDSE